MIRFRSEVAALFVLLSVAIPMYAAPRQRPARVIGVTLVGRVTDAADSSPVFGANVRVQGKTFVADERGEFVATGLTAGPATVTFDRWGYTPVSKDVNLQNGSNSLNASMAPKAVVRVTDNAGRSYNVDYDTSNFATQSPLSSYVNLNPAEFCRPDGTIAQIAKSQMSRITSSGTIVTGTPCCAAGAEGVQVTISLKTGEVLNAIAQECRFYRYDFVGRNRSNGQWLYLSFRQITDLQFP